MSAQTLAEYAGAWKAMWTTGVSPTMRATAAGSSASARTRSAASGPEPERVTTRTCAPAARSSSTTVAPTGPYPTTTASGVGREAGVGVLGTVMRVSLS